MFFLVNMNYFFSAEVVNLLGEIKALLEGMPAAIAAAINSNTPAVANPAPAPQQLMPIPAVNGKLNFQARNVIQPWCTKEWEGVGPIRVSQ